MRKFAGIILKGITAAGGGLKAGWRLLGTPAAGVLSVAGTAALTREIISGLRAAGVTQEELTSRSSLLQEIVANLTSATTPGGTWEVLADHFAMTQREEQQDDSSTNLSRVPITPITPVVAPHNGGASTLTPKLIQTQRNKALAELRDRVGKLCAAAQTSCLYRDSTIISYPINTEFYRVGQLLGLVLNLSQNIPDPDGGISSTTACYQGLVNGLSAVRVGETSLQQFLEQVDGEPVVTVEALLGCLIGLRSSATSWL